jgi:hypothetical protein
MHLIEAGRVRSTLKKHANYLWALSGEIIRDTSEVGFDKSKHSYDFVLGYVDNLGGPYWRHARPAPIRRCLSCAISISLKRNSLTGNLPNNYRLIPLKSQNFSTLFYLPLSSRLISIEPKPQYHDR